MLNSSSAAMCILQNLLVLAAAALYGTLRAGTKSEACHVLFGKTLRYILEKNKLKSAMFALWFTAHHVRRAVQHYSRELACTALYLAQGHELHGNVSSAQQATQKVWHMCYNGRGLQVWLGIYHLHFEEGVVSALHRSVAQAAECDQGV